METKRILQIILGLMALAVLVAVLVALVRGRDKYTDEQLAAYERKVTYASPITKEKGLEYVYVTESTNGKLNFDIMLEEPAVSYNFVEYCQTYRDIVSDVIGGDMGKIESLSVSYFRNDKPYLNWDTDDLISGYLYDFSKDESEVKKLTFENGKAEILELPK